MPRQIRIQFPGALYHVMCRGDRREAIFEDDDDREIFLKTLEEAAKRTGWLVHAYVLMGNHYHLLFETPEPNLVKGMTWFQGTYTARYNSRHKKSGHLFGGRYKAVLVEGDVQGDYFRTLLDYIHLNPVRAGITKVRLGEIPTLLSFTWSSLPHYTSRPTKRPAFLSTRDGFAAFNLRDGVRGRKDFIIRLEERATNEKRRSCGLSEIEGQGLQSTLQRGWCYGSAAFKEQMLELAESTFKKLAVKKGLASRNYFGGAVNDYSEEEAEKILVTGFKIFGLQQETLETLPKGAFPKALIAREIRARTSMPLAWITEKLKMGTTANIARAIIASEKAIKESRQLMKEEGIFVRSLR